MSPQILILGLPRTGTQSMSDALGILGYPKIYHMREMFANSQQQFWVDLIQRKQVNASDVIHRGDFEPVLKDWDGLSDFPASIFAVDLINAYPDAKIIITNRTEDSWIASMNKTLWGSYKRTMHEDADAHPNAQLRKAYHALCWREDFDAYGREYFRQYHAAVKQLAKDQNRQLLEFDLGEGWDRLCQFLGKPVPREEWPDSDAHRKP